MGISVGDAIVKIKGDPKNLDQALRNTQSKVQSAAQKMQKSMLPVGLAFTAIGAAGLKMVDSAREMNAALGVTALNLGVSTKEMRDLALKTTNVTFPLKEVTASFDLLARAGVKDTEVLKATATAFDTLGDATGNSASLVTSKMVPAMKTFGLSAEEVAGMTDAMTYLVRNTTVSMDNFGSVIGYITPELVTMGLTLDDTIALMAIMEGKGMSGEVATRAFRTAITEATREQIPLNEALGITNQEMEAYKEKLEGATGLTQEYADVANEQYGIMDKVKQKFDELVLSAGSFLTPLEPILAGMTALGPMMIFLSTSIGTATVKWIAHTIAMIASKVAAIALKFGIIGLTGAVAGLFAGIGLLSFGLMEVIRIWKHNKECLKAQIEFTKNLEKQTGELTAAQWKQVVAQYEDIKSRKELGKATEMEIDWLENLDVALKANIESMKYIYDYCDKVTEEFEKQVPVVKTLSERQNELAISIAMAADATLAQKKAFDAAREALLKYRRALAAGKFPFAGLSPFEIMYKERVGLPFPGFQQGGIAMRPMLARIGEQAPRIPEAVIPLDKSKGVLGGYRTLNLTIEMDGRPIVRMVEEKMVDDIRLRAGLHI